MWLPIRIFHPDREADSELQRTVRERLARNMEALKRRGPDTFLGRKTQEPFPQEDEQAQINRWLNSKELQPPK